MHLREAYFDIQLPGRFQATRPNTLFVNKRVIKAVLRGAGLDGNARIQRRDDDLFCRDLIL